MTDVTAWAGGNAPYFVSSQSDLTTGGNTCMSNQPNVLSQITGTDYIPIDAAFNYRIEATVKQLTGTTGTGYLGICWYDASKNLLIGSGATGWAAFGTGSYFGIAGTAFPTTWTSYSIGFGPNETSKQHPSAKFVRLIAYLNYNNVVGSLCALSRFALIRKTTGEVIVDGAITAAKIAANTITAGSAIISAAAISNAQIGNAIASSDFNGGIDATGVMTAVGTVGWALAKGNGTTGTSKMVIDAAHIRGKLQAGQIQAGAATNQVGYAAVSTACYSPGYVTSTNRSGTVDLVNASNGPLTTSFVERTVDWVCPAGVTWASFTVVSWTPGAAFVYFGNGSMYVLSGGVPTGSNLFDTHLSTTTKKLTTANLWMGTEGNWTSPSGYPLYIQAVGAVDSGMANCYMLVKNSTADSIGVSLPAVAVTPGLTYRIKASAKSYIPCSSGWYMRLNYGSSLAKLGSSHTHVNCTNSYINMPAETSSFDVALTSTTDVSVKYSATVRVWLQLVDTGGIDAQWFVAVDYSHLRFIISSTAYTDPLENGHIMGNSGGYASLNNPSQVQLVRVSRLSTVGTLDTTFSLNFEGVLPGSPSSYLTTGALRVSRMGSFRVYSVGSEYEWSVTQCIYTMEISFIENKV
jgi:hypothetical protein